MAVIVMVAMMFRSNSSSRVQVLPSPTITFPPAYKEQAQRETSHKYIGSSFEIAYPIGWGPYVYNFTSGQEVTFKPTSLPIKDVIPSLQVTVSSGSTSRVLQTQYQEYKKITNPYMESTVATAGQQATQLSGSMPFYVANGKRVDRTMWETIIYFEKDSELFTLRYRYASDTKDPKEEAFFTSFINTFSAN